MALEDGIRTTSGRGRLFGSVLDTIGDTPVIRVNNIAPDHVTMYVKAEAFNPAASVKDRLAVAERCVVRDAYRYEYLQALFEKRGDWL